MNLCRQEFLDEILVGRMELGGSVGPRLLGMNAIKRRIKWKQSSPSQLAVKSNYVAGPIGSAEIVASLE